MAKAGKRYSLIIYTRMMDRWWPPIFWIGVTLAILAWWFYRDLYTRLTQPWQWMTLAAVAGLCILVSLLMLALRKSAYVQAFGDHLLVATPFLHLNISYRRITHTTTASMAALFPIGRMSFLKRETIQPLLSMTAMIVELNSLPMSRSMLGLFLSPFFFKDKTPHLVLLVPNWMSFSIEMESMRVSGNTVVRVDRKSQPSILSQLPRK